jgi:hypothetical protein
VVWRQRTPEALSNLLADRGDTALPAGSASLKESSMRYPLWFSLLALGATVIASGCRDGHQAAGSDTATASWAHLTVPSGTSLDVSLGTSLSSETASVGDAWTASVVNGREGIPAGSTASGTVSAVNSAQRGQRAMLDLRLTSVTVAGHRYAVPGGTEAVVAGSTRARNLGAIAAATAAGALIGTAVGGTGKGTIIGAVVGGGAATGVVSQTRGWQVLLKQGTPLTFTTSEAVAVRS